MDGCILERVDENVDSRWNVVSQSRRLTGKISKVITECRSEIAKERNERARSARDEEKRTKERGVSKSSDRVLWSEDKRSVTEG